MQHDLSSVNHLHPKAKAYLERSDEERIACICSDRWIGYGRAKGILDKMEALFARPRASRMPGMLIVGGSNQGKTSLLNRFCANHPVVDNSGAEHIQMPVVQIQCPPGPDEKRFYTALLDALYRTDTTSIRNHAAEKHRQAKRIMEKVGTRVLILDEIHNILAGPTNRQRYFLNVLKYLSNDLRMPLIAAGTHDAHNAITTDPQLHNRLVPEALPRWDEGNEFTMLLNSLESLLPLWRPSELSKSSLSSEIMSLSEGVLGEAVSLLTQAACKAVNSGEERITLKIIKSVGFVRSSRRRKLADTDAQDGGVFDCGEEPAPSSAGRLIEAGPVVA